MIFNKLKQKAEMLYKIKQLREALPQLPLEDIISIVKEEIKEEKEKKNGK